MNPRSELILILLLCAGLFTLGGASSARLRAERNDRLCRASLQAIGRAAASYQADNGGAFQPVTVRTTNPWTYWNEFLKPYDSNPRHYACPENPRGEYVFDDDELIPQLYSVRTICYGMNFFLSSSGEAYQAAWPGNLHAVADPAYTVYFGDAAALTLRPTAGCWETDSLLPHENAANYLFLDGHIESLNRSTLGLYQNVDGWKIDVKRWKNWK